MTHTDRCRQERHCATPDRVASGKTRACAPASTRAMTSSRLGNFPMCRQAAGPRSSVIGIDRAPLRLLHRSALRGRQGPLPAPESEIHVPRAGLQIACGSSSSADERAHPASAGKANLPSLLCVRGRVEGTPRPAARHEDSASGWGPARGDSEAVPGQ